MSLRKIYPKLRLQAALGDPRGMRVDEAINRATTEMGTHSERAMIEIDRAISSLRVHAGESQQAPDPEEVYRLSEEVVDLAGLFAPALCRAAQSLCDLAAKRIGKGALDRAALSVHVESMLLLRMMGPDDERAAAVLAGLHAVVAKAR